MAKRKQFTFYESFYKALVKLPTEQAQQGAWTIVIYGLFGKKPDMELMPAADAVLEMAIPVLDSGRKKAEGAVNSHKNRNKNKDTVRIGDGCAMDSAWISDGCAMDTPREKEVENEVEVEKEDEIEIEKESFNTDCVCVKGHTDSFERFWDLYPVKLGKQQAWEIWQDDPPELDQIMTTLSCWMRSRQWLQENGRFIPKAATFLKEKYYLEIPKGTVPMGASGCLGKAELEAIERLMDGNV